MVRASADAMLAIGADGHVVFANDAAALLLGRTTTELVGVDIGLPIVVGEAVEVELLHPTHGSRVAELRVAQALDGIQVAVLRDVSQRVRLRTELQRLALADQLTGVGNRRAFLVLGEQALQVAIREQQPCTLLFIDIDQMKLINDRFGHRAGDRAVIETARMLNSTVRSSDIVARVGGDEFCVLLSGTGTYGSDGQAGQRVLAAAAALADRVEFPLSVTVGQALFDPADPVSIAELMDQADNAMYRAKAARGASGVVVVLGDDRIAEMVAGDLDNALITRAHQERSTFLSSSVDPDVAMLVVDSQVEGWDTAIANIRPTPSGKRLPVVVWQDGFDPTIEQQAFDVGADEVVSATSPAKVRAARLQRLLETTSA